jgi:hypothetical protein
LRRRPTHGSADRASRSAPVNPRTENEPYASRPLGWHTSPVDDEQLLARAEEALTQIKVAHGLSEEHASVLAALRIRLKGTADKSLEEMLEAAGDTASDDLAAKVAEAESAPKTSLDDLLSKPKPKPEWPS